MRTNLEKEHHEEIWERVQQEFCHKHLSHPIVFATGRKQGEATGKEGRLRGNEQHNKSDGNEPREHQPLTT
jgi:hypothetical protein